MSFANLMLYNSVLPSYDGAKNAEKPKQEVVNADDPRNREMVKKALRGEII